MGRDFGALKGAKETPNYKKRRKLYFLAEKCSTLSSDSASLYRSTWISIAPSQWPCPARHATVEERAQYYCLRFSHPWECCNFSIVVVTVVAV